MGPITLFDKSFLQSLSVDESVFFDHFFYPVISPLFYIETLADLEKAVRQGRTPEQEVGIIASKTPEMHGGVCAHHTSLCLANLMGHSVPMNGTIPVPGGRPVKANGQRGFVFKPSQEHEAFSRWQKGRFLEVERYFARAWRASLNSMDLLAVAAAIKGMGINPSTCKSLDHAKAMADTIVKGTRNNVDRMKLAFLILGIPRESEIFILLNWGDAGLSPLYSYAPYASHVLMVEIFFQIALAANLIATERASNRVDVAYLFYLPFCMIFVSSDKLHRRCAPLFLGPDQDFLWGEDLKADLKQLNGFYAKLPESEKEKGIMKFASYPPEKGEFLVSKMWDRHLQPWRGKALDLKPSIRDSEKEKDLVARIKKISESPTLPPDMVDFEMKDADMISIQRRVHKRKGSWWQLPKDLKSSNEK